MNSIKIKKFIKNNILYAFFVVSLLINSTVLRLTLLDNNFSLKPFFIDLGCLLVMGSFSYFIKPKSRVIYFAILSVILDAVCVINGNYYGYYTSFVSASLLATSVYIGGVSEALFRDVLKARYFIYVWQIIAFFYLNRILIKNKFYDKFSYIELKKNKIINFVKTIVISGVFIGGSFLFMSRPEWNRFGNLWNRESVVRSFGIYLYQLDDLCQSLKPQLNNLFGHDRALKETLDYYNEHKYKHVKNKYTGVLEGKNIIAIHAESIQAFNINKKFQGVEVTPNLNRLVKEGLYFSNFYSQIGVGTSSDAEFTYATSLMPSLNGTVFVNYYDNEFVTMQKLLKENDYYITSMHANNGEFWNRKTMHKKMGYDMFYDKEYFTQDEIIGLGLSDKSFFKQTIPYLKDINNNNKNFYATLIMLTNHTPFEDLDLMDEFDTTMDYNINGKIVKADPLKGTIMGNYFRSVHYADQAIQQLIDDLDKEGLLDNTAIVIYGDHEARMDKENFDLLYNYNPITCKLNEPGDDNYIDYNNYEYELDKKVPFIIWTKDQKFEEEITTPMGMIDVLPTLGNMLNIHSKYQLGTDIFNVDDNVVVFTDSSFLTKKMYYGSQKNEIYPLEGQAVLEDYIEKNRLKAESMIKISNNIISFDLIKEIEEKNELKAD